MHYSTAYSLNPADLSDHDLALLFQAESPLLREIVLADPRTPSSVIEAWLPNVSPNLHIAIARHPQTPPTILATFVTDATPWVRYYAASHPRLPIPLLRTLCTHSDHLVREACARNPALPPDLAIQLSQDPSADVVMNIACRPTLPLDRLEALATLDPAHPHALQIKRSVARNPAATGTILSRLLTTIQTAQDYDLAQTVADHPQATPEVLTALSSILTEPSAQTTLWARIVANPACPSSLLHTIALQTTHVTHRTLIAQAPQTLPETLAHLASVTSSKVVHEAVLAHPQTPAATRLTLTLRKHR